mmetsp:Transcript_6019/g.17762  ORF Transcript_6019/g.17762 Transcript_6019/m.17762 type:complete len:145 (-) Transcript_6019:25-459(-)
MFKGAIKPVVGGLANLRAEIKKLLQSKCARKLVGDLELNYGVLWEPVTDATLRVRARMAHPLHVARLEVAGALNRLLDSQNPDRERPAAADDTDDEIQDVTNEKNSEKRQALEVIDVDDMDVSNAPPAAPARASGPGGVKAEKK